MMKVKVDKNKQGSALLVFLLVMSIVLVLLLTSTYSRLLSSITRGRSSIDTLQSSYEAESEISDVFARLAGGYITASQLPIRIQKTIGGVNYTIDVIQDGDTYRVTSSVSNFLSSMKIIGERKVESIKKVDDVELILSLDCTGSMDAGANCANCFSKPTRFNALEDAAISFIDKLSTLSERSKFKLGVMVFGIDAKWATSGGREIRPNTNMSLDEIKEAVRNGLGDTRSQSPLCQSVMDATSVGSAYSKAQDYFTETKGEKTKQVVIAITDGDPNSRIPYSKCSPSTFCPAFPRDTVGNNYCENNQYGWQCHQYSQYQNTFDSTGFNQVAYDICKPLGVEFLRCTIADTSIQLASGPGVRDPDVDAYAVTIFSKPPAEIVSLFSQYLGAENYFNASRASQLTQILNTILNEVISDRETITIKRELPQ